MKTAVKITKAQSRLFDAAKAGHIGQAERALKNGAMLEDQTEHAETPIMVALQAKQYEFVHWLIKQGVNVNHGKRSEGFTVMHKAVVFDAPDHVLEALYQAGAKIDPVHPSHASPLCRAAEQGHAGPVRFLIRKGADVHRLSSSRNYSALEGTFIYDRKGDHRDVIRALLDAGADWRKKPADTVFPDMASFVNMHGVGYKKLIQEIETSARQQFEKFSAAASHERASMLWSRQGELKPTAWRMVAFGFLPQMMDEKHWLDAPQDALNLWNAVGPYYQQKHGNEIDLAFARRAANDTKQIAEGSKMGWATRSRRNQTDADRQETGRQADMGGRV